MNGILIPAGFVFSVNGTGNLTVRIGATDLTSEANVASADSPICGSRNRVGARNHGARLGGGPRPGVAQCKCKGRELISALAPFQRICTPMHTSRKDVSCMITVMPVWPRARPRRSEKP